MLPNARVNTILFDLGGVLIDWDPRYLYRPLFAGDDAAMEDFLARVCPPAWNVEMDAGKPFATAVAERQRLFPEHAQLIGLWHTGWPWMLRDAIYESVDVLARLRARGHRLLALTNWSAETFPIARSRFAFLEWFEDIVVSGEVKLVKPDVRIFELTVRRTGLEPGRTLYVDDSAPNVSAASALGFQTHHFTGPCELRAELGRHALL
jgi:2-haloacid dehalogenase